MSNSSSGLGKFLDFLIELLRALFGISKPATGGALEPQPPVTAPTAPEEAAPQPPATIPTAPEEAAPQPPVTAPAAPEEAAPQPPVTTPAAPADNTTEPTNIVTARVLLIVYDPIMDPDSGQKLSQVMNWKRVEELVSGFIADIEQTSGGLARYQIVQRIDVNEFPALADGYRYDPATYAAVLNKTAAAHKPETVDYQAILTGFSILPRVSNREIDEVWVFAFPYAGFYESTMGGEGAFWCNAPPLTGAAGGNRKFVLMGFSYERGVGEMLESFGHRAESLLARAFDCQDFVAWAYNLNRAPAVVASISSLNPFQRYLCFDQIAPGQAAIGTIHYAPNSERDYDWNNPRQVPSSCYGWDNFPAFENDIRQVNAEEWGSGDIRAHHTWWLKHLPKVAGRTSGILNNWWQYVMDPNNI